VILKYELQTSLFHCHTFLPAVIALMEEVAEEETSDVVDDAKRSTGMVKKQTGI